MGEGLQGGRGVKANLIWRVVTGVVFLPVLFFLIDKGGWAYSTLLFLIVTVGAWEWWRLCDHAGATPDFPLLLVGVLGALQGGSDPRPERFVVFLACVTIVALLSGLRHRDGAAYQRTAMLILGVLYVGLLPAFLLRIRDLPIGRDALLVVYAAVFACDTFAYGVGRLFGRHRLFERVSPKKTWEGAFGGLFGAVLACLVCRLLFADFLSLRTAIGMGLLLGSLGQAGDLVESLLKREAGLKDSSQLIPGHGGVLDRFDNLHLAAPAAYIFLGLCL